MFRLNLKEIRLTTGVSRRIAVTAIFTFATCLTSVASAQGTPGAEPIGSAGLKAHISSFTTAGGHTITFHGVQYDFQTAGESTWYYSVTSGSSPNVSHSTFGVPGCANISGAGTWAFPDKSDLSPGDGDPQIGTDPTTGIKGIKFDEATAAGTTSYYYFSLDGNYAIGHITAGVKAGDGEETGQINGPISDCSEPTGELIVEKQTDPDGSTQSFDFSGPDGANYSLSDGQTSSFDLPGGTYSVSETVPSGWTRTSATCDNGDAPSAVSLEIGETVTCTFVNTEFQENPAISIEKATNGQDADTPTGPAIPVGSPVTWTYSVTNTGDVSLTDVTVSDDQGVSVACPKTSLAPGEIMICTANGTATAGQYANLGTAEGTTPEEGTVSDSDPSHYFGAEIDLAITKTDGDLLFVAEGGTLVYTLSYENLSNVDLTGVVISETVPANTTFSAADSSPGWDCADGSASGSACNFTVGSVAAGGSGQVLFGLSVDEIWEPDPETGICPLDPSPVTINNTATITDDGSNGADTDLSNNTSSDDTPVSVQCEDLPAGSLDINIEKTPDVQQLDAGDTASFTIEVTNTGEVDLINVTVTDPQSPDCDNVIGDLAAGASVSYACDRTNVLDGFTNVATVTGEGEEGGNITDDDDALVFVLDEPAQMHHLVPTMSQWAIILTAALMLMMGAIQVRKWTRR